MNTDTPRFVATSSDITDPLPIDPAYHPTLTMDDVAALYENAGMPRNLRSLQRYAQQGKLTAQKIMTATGTQYLVTPHSVELHLIELRQMDAQARLVATGRDMARRDGTAFSAHSYSSAAILLPRRAPTSDDTTPPVAHPTQHQAPIFFDDPRRQTPPTSPDVPRHVATSHSTSVATPLVEDRYVQLLERENHFLRSQVETKDGQIKELTERSRETNMLVAGLQKMLSPLLGSGRNTSREV
jgi:hypothetical protein